MESTDVPSLATVLAVRNNASETWFDLVVAACTNCGAKVNEVRYFYDLRCDRATVLNGLAMVLRYFT